MEYTTVWLCVTFLHHNIGLHTFGRNPHVIMLNSSHHVKSYMLHHSVSASVHYEHLVKVVAARFLHYEITVFSFNGNMSCRRYFETMWISYYFSKLLSTIFMIFFPNGDFLILSSFLQYQLDFFLQWKAFSSLFCLSVNFICVYICASMYLSVYLCFYNSVQL